MIKINAQKIILVLIPVLFIFSGVSKADTFTYINYSTLAMGGAGFDNCGCQYVLTMQTDKPSYNENPQAQGGGDTVNVITSFRQGNSQMDPPNNLTVVNPGHNNDVMNSTQSNDYTGWSFQIGKDSNGSNLFWNPGSYGITAGLSGIDTSSGTWLINYNGNSNSINSGDVVMSSVPEIYFDVNQPACTTTQTDSYTASTNSSVYRTLVCHGTTDISGSRFDNTTFNYNTGDPYKNGTIDSISCSPSTFSYPQSTGTGKITYTAPSSCTPTPPSIFVK